MRGREGLLRRFWGDRFGIFMPQDAWRCDKHVDCGLFAPFIAGEMFGVLDIFHLLQLLV